MSAFRLRRRAALMLTAAPLLMLALPVQAQGWVSQRFDNSIVNADQITARYREEIQQEVERIRRRQAPLPNPTAREAEAVRTADAWWLARIGRSTGEAGVNIPVSLPFLYDTAMLNSAQLRVFGDLPAIRGTLADEVAGRFTPRAYGEGRAENVNDPTRSLANTRGSDRIIQRERAIEFGLRQRMLTGGDYTVGQRFVNLSTNSLDFQPNNQTRARTFITVVQPLLRDSGTQYVRSLHEVATLDGRVALSEFRRQVENQLLEISRAYWTLWLARASFVQKERALQSTREIAGQVAGRAELDVGVILASRAQAALLAREAEMLRARAAIRNAEARIRGLVNDPRFERENIGELLPNDAPLLRHEPLTLQTVLERSVAFRPEVQQVFLQHRLAVLREGQAQIEALPRFDAIAEGNFGGRGLDTFRFDDALADTRRNTDRMGGVIGFRLEIPLGNDNLQAEVNRRRIETRQIENQGRATLATVVSEAEIALTEYNIAFREIGARAIALRAARADTAAERERWTQGVGGAARDPNSLERLLSSIDRLVAAEEALATAQASFSLAFVAIQRVQGTFTAMQSIEIRRIEDAARGPAFVVRRAEATPASASSAGNTPPPSRPVGRTP